MNRRRLALRSLRFYWRTHLGVLIGAAIGAAVLIGALSVGDSVRHTLREQALERIGRIDVALDAGDRFVRSDLAAALGPEVAPVVRLDGIAATPDGSRRATDVQVVGADERFHRLGIDPVVPTLPGPEEALVNARFARQLDVDIGDTVVLRLELPSALPRDMILAVNEELSVALRVTVIGVALDEQMGRFGLEANQVPPYNAFVDLGWLQGELGVDGRANLLLAADVDPGAADTTLQDAWTLEDVELEVRPHPDADTADLLSRRVFIDDPVVDALGGAPAGGVLTYFVNELRHGPRATPYSMVSAVGPLGPAGDGVWRDLVPDDLLDGEIVINRWLADDLDASPGHDIDMTYFVLGPERRLEEATSTFRVRTIVALDGPAGDPTLMPDFPGLGDAENCRDWETGIPVDLDRIRDEDETYWDDHGGTPKAFVTLDAGRAMWGNRFGGLTAVRLEAPFVHAALASFRDTFDPASVGLYFRDVRGPAIAASTTATDFAGLFLGLSFFLIASALLLIALLFMLGIEQRAGEIGTLLATGFRPKDVRGLFLREAFVIALAGCVAGAALGLVYTRLVLHGLATVWRDAIGAATIDFHLRPASIAIGMGASLVMALVTILLAMRRQMRRDAVALLADQGAASHDVRPGTRTVRAVVIAVACVVLAVGLVALTGADRGPAAAAAFFGAGALLLVATLAASAVLLARLRRRTRPERLSLGDLGVRNGARRTSRSLAVVILVACGTFLVLAVGANRLDAGAGATERASGTGGFALLARSTIGLPQDLNAERGRADLGLDGPDVPPFAVVPLRLRAGDDASCLNLSLSQQPRLLGVDAAKLAERDAFTFAKTIDGVDASHPWHLLDADLARDGDGVRVIPAIGDQASLTWAMHKAVGDTLEYRDERGRPFRVRIVGAVANSVLQGNLVISESRFIDIFPSESGSRMFLIDAAPERTGDLAAQLSRALGDVGLEVTPAATRLAEFNAVQNTYLAIFQVLGGLGLLLGSAGLGMVVLRNVLERRGELALLRAVGFRTGALRWLVFSEHGLLLALGLAGGTLAALVAIVPVLRSPDVDPPVRATILVLAAITASGLFWTWLATIWGLRGPILDALRNE